MEKSEENEKKSKNAASSDYAIKAKDPRARVEKALSRISGSEELVRYFGISGMEPEQPASVAVASEQLFDELRIVSTKPDSKSEMANLLKRVTTQAETSAIDPKVLRQLMYKRKTSKA